MLSKALLNRVTFEKGKFKVEKFRVSFINRENSFNWNMYLGLENGKTFELELENILSVYYTWIH